MINKMSTSCNFQFVGSARNVFFLIFDLLHVSFIKEQGSGREVNTNNSVLCETMSKHAPITCRDVFSLQQHCGVAHKTSRMSAPSTFSCPALQQAQTGLATQPFWLCGSKGITVWAAASVPCRQREQSFLLAPWNRFYTAKVALCGCWAAQSECASLAWV